MAETKHTPGPWDLCDRGDYSDFDGNSRVILDAGDTIRIAVVHTYGDEENEANARLIAAAPELYAALKPFADLTVNGELPPVFGAKYPHFARAVETARAALAKARKE